MTDVTLDEKWGILGASMKQPRTRNAIELWCSEGSTTSTLRLFLEFQYNNFEKNKKVIKNKCFVAFSSLSRNWNFGQRSAKHDIRKFVFNIILL